MHIRESTLNPIPAPRIMTLSHDVNRYRLTSYSACHAAVQIVFDAASSSFTDYISMCLVKASFAPEYAADGSTKAQVLK
jgi:hypothetical protein